MFVLRGRQPARVVRPAISAERKELAAYWFMRLFQLIAESQQRTERVEDLIAAYTLEAEVSTETTALFDWETLLESAFTPNLYPEALDKEYNALIKTQWSRSLTAEETERLEAIKAEINALDAASEQARLWERQMDVLERRLTEFSNRIEALPDAN